MRKTDKLKNIIEANRKAEIRYKLRENLNINPLKNNSKDDDEYDFETPTENDYDLIQQKRDYYEAQFSDRELAFMDKMDYGREMLEKGKWDIEQYKEFIAGA